MWWLAALVNLSWGTTFPPALPLSEQFARAEVAGVYVVRAIRTVTLEDGFVATRAEIQAVGTPVRGEVHRGILGLPGGMVGVRYVESMEGAPRVSAGDRLFLFLQRHKERYILAGSFADGLYRRVEGPSGPLMVDGEGAVITAVSCDAVPERRPGAAGLPWADAVEAFVACGGVR